MNAILFLAGLALLAAGIAQVSIPAAMVTVGLVAMLLAVLLARAESAARPTPEVER